MNVVEALYRFAKDDDMNMKDQSRAIICWNWINWDGSIGFPRKVEKDLPCANVRHFFTANVKETLQLYVKERVFMEVAEQPDHCFVQLVVTLE